ncbi:type III-A CRISPR-associated protein Csm2 [Catalinimonas sp. 4WD22]|uniref:type III-A CRISPR-associated protein Csm2 n=1 Tax=Catalinimonas locisalis TaxID=3133978 RepID=UPI003100BC89
MYEQKNTEQFRVWIQSEEGLPDEAIKWAAEFGSHLAKGEGRDGLNKLSTSQLRKFFGQMKRLQIDMLSGSIRGNQGSHSGLLMLKPQLAYAKGRDLKTFRNEAVSQTKIADFEDQISKAIDGVEKNNKKHFKNFVNLVEAIVAYHKAQGGE